MLSHRGKVHRCPAGGPPPPAGWGRVPARASHWAGGTWCCGPEAYGPGPAHPAVPQSPGQSQTAGARSPAAACGTPRGQSRLPPTGRRQRNERGGGQNEQIYTVKSESMFRVYTLTLGGSITFSAGRRYALVGKGRNTESRKKFK